MRIFLSILAALFFFAMWGVMSSPKFADDVALGLGLLLGGGGALCAVGALFPDAPFVRD